MTQLPEGYTVQKTRIMYKLVGPEGQDILFGLTEEACRRCCYCLPQFGGTVGLGRPLNKHVDL